MTIIKASLMSNANDIDIIQIENDLEELGIDLDSDAIMSMTAEELANMAIEKEKQAKEQARKEREERKRKEELARRLALLPEKDAYAEYSKLMRDFPNFDMVDPNTHWTAHLVRILNITKYKHHVDLLANKSSIVGDIESVSNLAIVKSHLSRAVFDDIWSHLTDFVVENPMFEIQNEPVEKVAVSYSAGESYKLDENAETSSDPEWGSW